MEARNVPSSKACVYRCEAAEVSYEDGKSRDGAWGYRVRADRSIATTWIRFTRITGIRHRVASSGYPDHRGLAKGCETLGFPGDGAVVFKGR